MRKILPFFLLFAASTATAQPFTRQDSLRGSVTPERAWWDLLHYDLSIKVEIEERAIEGQNVITYRVLEPATRMQIDLQPPMAITKAVQNGGELRFEREGNVFWIEVPAAAQGETRQITLYFSGKPVVSKMPPWQGGFTWKKDSNGKPFVATSCQGEGASMWWPCKDHMYDEPDSMDMHYTVPIGLVSVGNGHLAGIDTTGDWQTFHWEVNNPINNYGVNLNIGDYVHFSEVYEGEKGPLSCDYYVLRANEEKARKQFEQVPMMLEAFEHWFGPYPFYEDGYKLVEVPYLGMEHQSSVTYGNEYKNGYQGSDLSMSGWGLKFDFIIIHESGHEWFANSITYKDIADMWIHESFTAYSENLYLDYHFGKEAATAYVVGTRLNIQNDKPIIGPYDVNEQGSGDMYYKGANMLHILRTLLNDDEKWRNTLRGLNTTFYHQTVTTLQIESYLAESLGMDLTGFFDQYLRDKRIPQLEYVLEKGKLRYRWANCVPHFDMPVEVLIDGSPLTLKPTTEWQTAKVSKEAKKITLNKNYLALLKKGQ